MKKIILLFLLIFQTPNAKSYSVVSVGEATLEKDNIQFVLSSQVAKPHRSLAASFIKLIKGNFGFYKRRFNIFPKDQKFRYKSKSTTSSINFKKWKKLNIDYLVHINLSSHKGQLIYQAELMAIHDKKSLKKFYGTFRQQTLHDQGNDLSNRIFYHLTGKNSIFKSKILFVSDIKSTGRGSKRIVRKEIYVVDFNGANIKRLTHHGGIVISPSISHRGDKIIYSLIKKGRGKKRIQIYLYDLIKNKKTLLSKRKGLNSGGIFLPGDEEILLTLSSMGNAEIYAMNLKNRKLRRITNHFATDVDPSINLDGTLMTFLSNRSGKAHVYTLDPRGKEKDVRRISFVGQFNANPRFSPDGKEIVFSSWVENQFDLFKMDSQGNGLVRLTKNLGSNESPSFSQDGEFIVFSSQKILSVQNSVSNILLMNKDGETIIPIVKNFGNCSSPRWAPNFLGML
jgi:TolB protein